MKQIDGIWWPDADQECHPVVPGQVKDVDKAIALCRGMDCAVQAGGNVGIWPNYLSEWFETVWTAEPDEENYQCLLKNLNGGDIRTLPCAFGDAGGLAGLTRDPKNAGAHFITQGAEFPVNIIDAIPLQACDLIVLDVEGYEPLALEGARDTIEKYHPVIMVEDKGLSEKYGHPQGWSETFPGYEVAERIHRDVILV